VKIGYIQIGDIGDSTKAEEVVAQIDVLSKDHDKIVFNISSFGGNVFDAFDIYDKIVSIDSIETEAVIQGKCMSAATVIACACDRTIAGEGSTFMVHNSLTPSTSGNAKTLTAEAQTLRHFDEKMVIVYKAKTGKTDVEIRELMSRDDDDGAWLNAHEAKELGFIDEIQSKNYTQKKKKQAMLAYAQFKNENKMSKPKNTLYDKLSKFMAMFTGMQEGEGQLVIDGDFSSEDSIGKPVGLLIDGQFSNAPEGPHVLADGATITVDADGNLVSYEAGEGDEEESTEEASASKGLTEDQVAKMIEDSTKPILDEVKAISEANAKGAELLDSMLTRLEGQKAAPKGKVDKTGTAGQDAKEPSWIDKFTGKDERAARIEQLNNIKQK